MKRNTSTESLLSQVSDVTEFRGVDPGEVSFNLSKLTKQDFRHWDSTSSLRSSHDGVSIGDMSSVITTTSGERHHQTQAGIGYGSARPEF